MFQREPEGRAITGLLHRDNLMFGTGSMPLRQPAFVPLSMADLHFEEDIVRSPPSVRLAALICCFVPNPLYGRLVTHPRFNSSDTMKISRRMRNNPFVKRFTLSCYILLFGAWPQNKKFKIGSFIL